MNKMAYIGIVVLLIILTLFISLYCGNTTIAHGGVFIEKPLTALGIFLIILELFILPLMKNEIRQEYNQKEEQKIDEKIKKDLLITMIM